MAIVVGFHCDIISCELVWQVCGVARLHSSLHVDVAVLCSDLGPRLRAVYLVNIRNLFLVKLNNRKQTNVCLQIYRLCTKSYLADGKDGYDVFRSCHQLVKACSIIFEHLSCC